MTIVAVSADGCGSGYGRVTLDANYNVTAPIFAGGYQYSFGPLVDGSNFIALFPCVGGNHSPDPTQPPFIYGLFNPALAGCSVNPFSFCDVPGNSSNTGLLKPGGIANLFYEVQTNSAPGPYIGQGQMRGAVIQSSRSLVFFTNLPVADGAVQSVGIIMTLQF